MVSILWVFGHDAETPGVIRPHLPIIKLLLFRIIDNINCFNHCCFRLLALFYQITTNLIAK